MTPPIMAPMTYFEELDSLAVSKKNPLSVMFEFKRLKTKFLNMASMPYVNQSESL